MRTDEIIALVKLIKFHRRVINEVVWDYIYTMLMKFIALYIHIYMHCKVKGTQTITCFVIKKRKKEVGSIVKYRKIITKYQKFQVLKFYKLMHIEDKL